MLLGALVDAGVEVAALKRELGMLRLEGYELETRRVTRAGLAATQAIVRVDSRSVSSHPCGCDQT